MVQQGMMFQHKQPLKKRLWKARWFYLLMLPGILYFIIYKYVPMFGLVMAFQDYSPSLGLFSFPAPVILALFLNEIRHKGFKRVTQTLMYLPHFLSAVVVCSITYQLFSVEDGVINHILNALGFESVNVLMNEAAYRSLFVGLEIWQGTGWGTIIYLAALSSVDVQMYEASMLEGANRWQQMWYITLPSILPIVMVTLVLRMGDLLDVGLEKTLLLSNAMNRQVAEVFDSYVYQRGVVDGRYSFSSAVGLFKSAVGLLLVLGSNYLSKKVTDETIY